MELVLIGLAALLASALTLFSGFGLGTLLLPVFALFLPLPLAISATACVHLANNLFKLALLGGQADWVVVLRFGLPAALAAFAGAALLALFDHLPALGNWSLAGREFTVTLLKLVIGLLIMLFAVLEMWPRFRALALPRRWLPLGGLLSGFFGGLSGNQGALRSAFLLKAGMSKEGFVATGVVVAVGVDVVRLGVYGGTVLDLRQLSSGDIAGPVLVAVLAAFAGSLLANRWLRKTTLAMVQAIVASAMLLIGAGLAAGML